MEENKQIGVKIYKKNAITVGTFLGGPLVAGYLFSENFKSFDEIEKVKPTWYISITTLLITVLIIALIPEDIKIPNQLFPLIHLGIVYGLFATYQEERVKEHIAANGPVYSWWRVIGISLIGLCITIGIAFSGIFIFEADTLLNNTVKTYGTTVQHEIEYNQKNITEAEIDNIAAGFTESAYFGTTIPKYIYVEKEGEKYIIFLPITSQVDVNQEVIQFFEELKTQMDDFLPNHKVEFRIVVDFLDNVVHEIK